MTDSPRERQTKFGRFSVSKGTFPNQDAWVIYAHNGGVAYSIGGRDTQDEALAVAEELMNVLENS